MNTTLAEIRKHKPCKKSWVKLLAALSKTKDEAEPLPFSFILLTLGLQDAIWCLRALPDQAKQVALFTVALARRMECLDTNPRIKTCLDTTEAYLEGRASLDELRVSMSAAGVAARSAAAAGVAMSAAGAAWADETQAQGELFLQFFWRPGMTPLIKKYMVERRNCVYVNAEGFARGQGCLKRRKRLHPSIAASSKATS